MYYRENINNALEYINHNLENDISIDDISNVAGFSTSHFYKLFASSTGFTLKEYLRNKRLSKAAKKLVKSDNRIIDIAMDAGFNSHEVFTRAFTSLYGISPIKYRKNRKEILLYENFNTFGKSIKNRFRYKDDININVEVIEKNEIYLAGMDLKTNVIENIKKKTLRNFWQSAFLPNTYKIKNIINPNNKIYFEITNPKTNELYHLACFEVYSSIVPTGMILKVIPPQKYAVFTPEKPLSALEYSSLITYAYGEWLPISGYQLADKFTFDVTHSEKNSSGCVSKNMKVYIPIK